MKDKRNFCQWPRCNNESDIIYYGLGLCDKCWDKFCEMDMVAAKKKLGINEEVKVVENIKENNQK